MQGALGAAATFARFTAAACLAPYAVAAVFAATADAGMGAAGRARRFVTAAVAGCGTALFVAVLIVGWGGTGYRGTQCCPITPGSNIKGNKRFSDTAPFPLISSKGISYHRIIGLYSQSTFRGHKHRES